MKKRLAGLILLVSAIQLAVPASMLLGRERTLREGEVFKFQTAPVDPYDAFRGRYVALSVGNQTVEWDGEPLRGRRHHDVYASIEAGPDGYAVVTCASRRPPESGAYVRAYTWNSADRQVNIRLPIDRYYLPEDEAPAAERAYRANSRRDNRAAEVVVRVRNGDLVIEDLLVEGLPIREWLAQQGEETEN